MGVGATAGTKSCSLAGDAEYADQNLEPCQFIVSTIGGYVVRVGECWTLAGRSVRIDDEGCVEVHQMMQQRGSAFSRQRLFLSQVHKPASALAFRLLSRTANLYHLNGFVISTDARVEIIKKGPPHHYLWFLSPSSQNCGVDERCG